MKTALVGWRGMVGSVLMGRMEEEGDFEHIDADFFSTSQAGEPAPRGRGTILDSEDLEVLAGYDVVLSCQGGGYTSKVYEPLRESGWNGYWIDAASTLRMHEDAMIVLDPVNRDRIDAALDEGKRTFAGGNCTVSLLLMALAPLFRNGWVEWLNSMTYQAASGAGAGGILELVDQMVHLADRARTLGEGRSALELDEALADELRSSTHPTSSFGAPLGASLLPWIDSPVDGGRTREEWKGHVETQKILGLAPEVPVDGLCVRVPNLRCHSQAVTVKLTEPVGLDAIEEALGSSHQWIDVVPNDQESTLARLTPAAVTGGLTVAVGRLHKLRQGEDYLGLFTVGDQLLWGAAEPLRRMLRILTERHGG